MERDADRSNCSAFRSVSHRSGRGLTDLAGELLDAADAAHHLATLIRRDRQRRRPAAVLNTTAVAVVSHRCLAFAAPRGTPRMHEHPVRPFAGPRPRQRRQSGRRHVPSVRELRRYLDVRRRAGPAGTWPRCWPAAWQHMASLLIGELAGACLPEVAPMKAEHRRRTRHRFGRLSGGWRLRAIQPSPYSAGPATPRP